MQIPFVNGVVQSCINETLISYICYTCLGICVLRVCAISTVDAYETMAKKYASWRAGHMIGGALSGERRKRLHGAEASPPSEHPARRPRLTASRVTATIEVFSSAPLASRPALKGTAHAPSGTVSTGTSGSGGGGEPPPVASSGEMRLVMF